MQSSKLKKTLLISFSALILLGGGIVAFFSPLVKYAIEKYDTVYTGREISLHRVYANPFTGYIYLSDLKIYELESDSVFFSAKSLSADFSMRKLFSGTYEISGIILEQPKGIIVQHKKQLNFSDIITLFSPEAKRSSLQDKRKKPIHFNVLHIKIIDGEFHYAEQLIPVSYFIKHVNIESFGKSWDTDTLAFSFSFVSGIGKGDMQGNMCVNFRTKDYRLTAVANKYDLQIIDQYLKDLTNYQHFTANFDAAVKASGNFSDKENIIASGLLTINDFHFGKDPQNDYAAFEKLVLDINELSPKNHKYLLDSVSLHKPYFRYERYDSLDNVQTMFGKKGANIKAAAGNPERFNLIIEMARYVKVLSKNFFKSNYQLGRLAIYEGDLHFNDYSVNEKFSMQLNPLTAIADSIDKDHPWVSVSLRSGILPYGELAVQLKINPNDSSDFNIQYHLQKLPLAALNPYIITYTSFPLDRGTLDFSGSWKVRNSMIESDNHLVMIDPRVSEKIRHKDSKWIPMPLVFYFIRERGNVIDYEIPIRGNLKDPNFRLKDVILDLVENIFVKPVTTPYRWEVKNTEVEIEKSLSLKWPMHSDVLLSSQESFLKEMADFLADHPDASITVAPLRYALKEKEYILLYEAKKKYFLSREENHTHPFDRDDSLEVEKMSLKDPAFLTYLNHQVPDTLLFSVQERSAGMIDSATVNSKFQQLNASREKIFMSFFRSKKVQQQLKFSPSENGIPYNGFSLYKIAYKGGFPESLMKAYARMNALDDKAPRKKFREERKRVGH